MQNFVQFYFYKPKSYRARNKSEVFLKVKPEPGPNTSPTRKALPDLQLSP